MHDYAPHLAWIDTLHEQMCQQVIDWCNINSGTENLAGIAAMADALRREFAVLGGTFEELPVPPAESIDSQGRTTQLRLGPALRFTNRHPDGMQPGEAASGRPLRVLLNIHRDTVYGIDHPFQTCTRLDARTLRGPGVIDAKGGLVVMLAALRAIERSPFADRIGWEVLINADEEIGSPGSAGLLARTARENDLGLLFEPALPDGSLVSRRRGTGNFTVVVRGRSAHAGRDFERGRSAVVTLAEMVLQLHALNGGLPGITVNVGRVEGGGAVNVVPDLAIARVNVRTTVPDDEAKVIAELRRIVAAAGAKDGISAELHGGITSPPKLPDDRTRRLMEVVESCGRDLGLPINWRDSGGASDGNKLAAAGLPNIDTLGPRGGNIHSPEEFLLLDSLVERAKLTALVLMKLVSVENAGS
jgi:glutamate carboxypeptidase